LTPRAVLTPPRMSSLRLSLPYRVLTALRCRRPEPRYTHELPMPKHQRPAAHIGKRPTTPGTEGPTTCWQHRSTDSEQQGRNTGFQRPTPKCHTPTTGSRTAHDETHRSTVRQEQPQMQTVCHQRRNAKDRHPASKHRCTSQHRGVDCPGPAPDSGHQRPTPRCRASAASTLAPATRSLRRNADHVPPASGAGVRRRAPKHLPPTTRVPIPASNVRHRSTERRGPAPKHRASKTAASTPATDTRHRSTEAPTTDTEAPTDDRLPCGLLPSDVFPT
jgi:hypothetical protein